MRLQHVPAVRGDQRLKGKTPQWAVRYKNERICSSELRLRGPEQKLVQFAGGGPECQVTTAKKFSKVFGFLAELLLSGGREAIRRSARMKTERVTSG